MATLQFSEGIETPPRVLHRNKQLLNNIVDGMASTRPCALYAEVPCLPDSYRDGYRKITYGALANAVNGVAWLLKEKIGESRDHQTLSYIGPNDLAYVIMVLGACKAGFKVNDSLQNPQYADLRRLKLLLVSPRNTVSDHISLFKATECRIMLTPPAPRSPIVQAIIESHPLQLLNSPTLDELLRGNYAHYPFCKSFAEARHEPLVVVHTSGTTAVPKPIVYTHDFAASYIQWTQLEPPPGFETQVSLCQSNRFFITLPFFHVSSLITNLPKVWDCGRSIRVKDRY